MDLILADDPLDDPDLEDPTNLANQLSDSYCHITCEHLVPILRHPFNCVPAISTFSD